METKIEVGNVEISCDVGCEMIPTILKNQIRLIDRLMSSNKDEDMELASEIITYMLIPLTEAFDNNFTVGVKK